MTWTVLEMSEKCRGLAKYCKSAICNLGQFEFDSVWKVMVRIKIIYKLYLTAKLDQAKFLFLIFFWTKQSAFWVCVHEQSSVVASGTRPPSLIPTQLLQLVSYFPSSCTHSIPHSCLPLHVQFLTELSTDEPFGWFISLSKCQHFLPTMVMPCLYCLHRSTYQDPRTSLYLFRTQWSIYFMLAVIF